jgi:polyisoprenoid-binding protein YceI
MKKVIIATVAIFTLALVSFQIAKPKKGNTYVLRGKSELMWKGEAADKSHGHFGTVDITSGKMEYTGDMLKSANFVVNLKTMKSELPKDKGADGLYGHLGTADFFNYMEMPETKVTITKIENGTATGTLNLIGKDLPVSFPVTVTKNKTDLTMAGKFTVDFSPLGIPGFTPSTKPGEENKHVSPKIDFELNVNLKAGK